MDLSTSLTSFEKNPKSKKKGAKWKNEEWQNQIEDDPPPTVSVEPEVVYE